MNHTLVTAMGVEEVTTTVRYLLEAEAVLRARTTLLMEAAVTTCVRVTTLDLVT